jgi:A/G-specific adenine glycosylase
MPGIFMASDQLSRGSSGKSPLPPTPELSPREVEAFRQTMYGHFRRHGRSLPWRARPDPYAVLVSEIMLQQTQVERVAVKYGPFLVRFPDFETLARAPRREVLDAWQGLGYNRRALSLQGIARRVVQEFKGRLPQAVETLRTLPGIGPATAGAVAAFAFGQPAVFLETNIRRVFLHFFFPGRHGVTDRELLPLVAQTLDRTRPRRWYYALMDYGAWLKKAEPNPNRRSAHYQRPAPFQDSDRQIRGLILKRLLQQPVASGEELARMVGQDPRRVARLVRRLAAEGFLERHGAGWSIASRRTEIIPRRSL